jgi:hypothetical protein
MAAIVLSLWLGLWNVQHAPQAANLAVTWCAPAASSAPAQEPPPPDPAEEQRRNGRVALALVVAIVCSSVALGVAFGIRRRIDMVAGPPDEDDE